MLFLLCVSERDNVITIYFCPVCVCVCVERTFKELLNVALWLTWMLGCGRSVPSAAPPRHYNEGCLFAPPPSSPLPPPQWIHYWTGFCTHSRVGFQYRNPCQYHTLQGMTERAPQLAPQPPPTGISRGQGAHTASQGHRAGNAHTNLKSKSVLPWDNFCGFSTFFMSIFSLCPSLCPDCVCKDALIKCISSEEFRSLWHKRITPVYYNLGLMITLHRLK